MKKILKLLFALLLLTSSAQAAVWPRQHSNWNRLGNGGTVSGTIKVPVIFVNFSQDNNDDAYVVSDANQTAWINNLNASTGYGANKYFSDMSYGKVNVEFVKVGTYTANNKASNWGGNSRATLAANAIQNVTYATGLSKSSWSDFDSNGDDFVDAVLIVFAGHADGDNRSTGSSVSSINPHSSFVDSGNGTTYTGISKKFSRYVLINDLGHNKSTIANLGTALHELGHGIFDLPDYYGGSNVSYMGFWDCMDYGTFFGDVISTPNPVPGLSAFSRMLTGWLTPKELTYGQHVTLHPLNNNAEAYMIKESDTHYYILEARAAKIGSWDAGLTSGLILTEVNETDGGSWIINHTTNDGRVKVVRADKTAWTSSNYSSNINTQPFGPNVKAIDSSYGSIFATKTVENIVVNSDGSVEFDFMGGDPDNTMSLENLTDGTIVQVSNFYGLGTLVNDNNTVKAVGGSQNIVDRYYTDGRTYNTSYSATPSATNENHLWQVMSNNGQKYLVNVGTAQTVNVANPTALINPPTSINITAINGLTNAYTLSSTEGKMSASVFKNIPAGYVVVNPIASGYAPNGQVFKYTVNNYNSNQNLHITADLSTCQREEENVLSLGENIDDWYGNHVQMFYTKAKHELAVWLMRNQNETKRYDITLTSTDLVVDLLDNVLTINGVRFTTADKPLLAGLTSLTTIVVGTAESEKAKSSFASNYNISIGHYNYTDSAHPVSAIATDDYTTAWVFREVTGITPLTPQEVFGGDVPTPTTATITVTPISKTMEIGDTQQLIAKTNSNATITYSSSNTNVATVSNTGLVTAVSAGSATITVSVPANSQFTAASTTCAITVNEATVDPEETTEETSILWPGNAENSNLPASRIPALVRAADGTLVAFSDIRYSHNDIGNNGHIDIQTRRSFDNGNRWTTPAVTIADGTGRSGAVDCGYGDAAAVADNGGSGKVMMICAAGSVSFPNSTNANPIHITKFISNDNGKTWSSATDITNYIYNTVLPKEAKVFFSSGKITQSRNYRKAGSNYNRLYSALVTGTGNYVVYSDDFGDTWKILGSGVGQVGDEARVLELPNGDLLLTGRKGWGEFGRWINIFKYTNKENGTGTWGTTGQETGTPTSSCHGDIDLVECYKNGEEDPTYVLIQSAPLGHSPRKQLTYYYKEISHEEGHTYNLNEFTSGWTQGLMVCNGASAYSSILSLGNCVEAMLYEQAENPNFQITSSKVNPDGYNITFVTHTIDQITNNAFKATPSPSTNVTIKYVYTDSKDSNIQLTGTYKGVAEDTEPTVTLPNYCTVSNKQWANNGDGTWTFSATVTANYPFTPSTASKEYYYFVNSNNGNGQTPYWMSSDAGVTYSVSQPTDLDKGTWAFVGNWATGFAIKNKAGNFMYTTEFVDATNSNDGTQIGLSAENSTTYDLVVDTHNNNTVGEFKYGSHYLSFHSSNVSYLSYYGADHAGVRFYFTLSETVEIDIPEDVEEVIKMGPKQEEKTRTVTKTVYKASTATIARGSETEFLILSANRWKAMGENVNGVVDIQDAEYNSGSYPSENVNKSGNAYSFILKSNGHLYNVGLKKYLKVTDTQNRGNYTHTLSYEDQGSTIWTLSGTGSSSTLTCTITTGNNRTGTGYLTSPGSAFTIGTNQANISIFTPSTEDVTETTYVDETKLIEIKTPEGYATYYNEGFAYEMPEGVTGYFITDANQDSSTLNPVVKYKEGSIVPPNTALLLYNGTSGTAGLGKYDATIYEEKTSGTKKAMVFKDKDSNQLKGKRDSDGTTIADQGDVYYYKLTYKNGENLGFYWGGENGGRFKLTNPTTAYLVVPKSSNAKGFVLPTDLDDEETAIKAVGIEETTSVSNAVYNIAGQRVDEGYRGIIIKNGKKYLNK